MSEQITDKVVLVPPTGFQHDPETAASNAFQQDASGKEVTREAMKEFDGLVAALGRQGIHVDLLAPRDPAAPNAVFPNNWFSTDAQGRVVLYPMATPSRRAERDAGLGAWMRHQGHAASETIDLGGWEAEGLILEGTGSLVLDRSRRTAYACWSPRTMPLALVRWCSRMGHTAVGFHATVDGKPDGQPVYHTNVMMAIGERFAVVALEAIHGRDDRARVMEQLDGAAKEVIPINLAQMHAFAGNVLQLQGGHGPCILLSATAHAAFTAAQRRVLARHGELVPVAVPVIEAVGGGSVRCMIAENFLPSRPKAALS